MRLWHDATSTLGLQHGVSFALDCHTIPFHGEDALVQKHYVSKRSRRQKGMLAFLAHDADTRRTVIAAQRARRLEFTSAAVWPVLAQLIERLLIEQESAVGV